MNMLLTVNEGGNLPGIGICCTRNLPIRSHISHSTVTSLSNNNPNLRSSPRLTNPSHLRSSSNRAEPDNPLLYQLSVVVQMGTNTSRSISLRSTFIKDHCAFTVISRVISQPCVPTGMCLLFPQTTWKIPPQHLPSSPSCYW